VIPLLSEIIINKGQNKIFIHQETVNQKLYCVHALLGNEWGNSWFLIVNAVNSYLKEEFNIKADYLEKKIYVQQKYRGLCCRRHHHHHVTHLSICPLGSSSPILDS